MAAGIVDHETGTRDLGRLSGLYKAMPITATLAMVAAASMAGVPLLNGFISKEMFFAETTFVSGDWTTRVGLPLAATVAGAFSVAYSLRFILQVFFGPPATDLPRAPHEPPRWMLFPSALLVFMCLLLVGVFPAYTVGPFLATAAQKHPGRGHAGIQPGRLARREPAAGHERGRHDGGRGAVPGAARAPAGQSRPRALHLPLRRPAQLRETLLDGSSVAASWLLRWLASSRLQVQMLLIVLGTLFVAWLPLRAPAAGWMARAI